MSPECLSPTVPAVFASTALAWLSAAPSQPAVPSQDIHYHPHDPAWHQFLTLTILSGVRQHSKPNSGESLIKKPQSKLQLSYTYLQFYIFCTFYCPYLLWVCHRFFDWLMAFIPKLSTPSPVISELHLDVIYRPLCNARGVLHKPPSLFWWTVDSLLISLVSNCISVTLSSSSLLHLHSYSN